MRMVMKAASAGLALALCLGAPAANAASFEKAARLADAMGVEDQIDRAIGDLIALLRTQMTQQGQAADKVDAFLAVLNDELNASAPALVDDIARVYAEKLTDAEVDDIIDFYGTPTGRKLVAIQDEIVKAQTQAIAAWIQAAAQSASQRMSAGGASV